MDNDYFPRPCQGCEYSLTADCELSNLLEDGAEISEEVPIDYIKNCTHIPERLRVMEAEVDEKITGLEFQVGIIQFPNYQRNGPDN